MDSKINFDTCYYNDKQREKFYAIFRECTQIFGCYYMGYIFEDLSTKTRLGFTTNPDWQNIYIGEHLVDECHLWREVSKYFSDIEKQHLILPWSLIKPETSKQKEIILYREEMNIGQDGISFCTKSKQGREYLYFAPEKNEKSFLKYVNLNLNVVKDACRIFREANLQKKSLKNNIT